MLQELRLRSQSFLVYIVFGVIILAFIFTFNMQPDCSSFGRGGDAMVKVNDHEVDELLLLRTIKRTMPNASDTPELRLQTAQNMGMVLLLSDLAEEAGLRVSDDDLRDYIRGRKHCNPDGRFYIDKFIPHPAYQRRALGPYLCLYGGEFLPDAYDSYLRRYGLSKSGYEKYKRRELLALEYLLLLEHSIVVGDHEVELAILSLIHI